MKLLLIGLDGVDQQIVDRFDMPYLKKLLAAPGRTSLPIHEDLWSRGWSKILSGLPGEETSAFYEKPRLDRTTGFTQKFGPSDYEGLRLPPLWKALEERKARSGWFGIPTTIPAIPVDGFMVSGAGGGYSPAGRLPDIACHPPKLRKMLAERQFVWENRFVASGDQSAEMFLQNCTNALWRRARIFVDLCNSHRTLDFGFFFEKESVLVSNIFGRAITLGKGGGSGQEQRIFQKIAALHSTLDDTIEFIVESLNARHVGIVSDHGMAVYSRSFNLNQWLHKNGWLRADKAHKSHPSCFEPLNFRIARRLKRIREEWQTGSSAPAFAPAIPINFGTSRAFSHFYIPGIYLNDSRFGGPISDSSQTLDLAEQIVKEFNEDPETKRYGFSARLYRSRHEASNRSDVLPDIWVDHPVEYFPEQRGPFVGHNPYDRYWGDFRYLDRDIASGKKSPHALCNFEEQFVGSDGGTDLTAAYRIVLNHFA